ncbi:McrC family protein [Neobacillus citreus]|uniref:McrC family protein n=1 Tax=Neobacillus citreus TaxID=2833578 RepID=A0A942T6H8_9BACI|nr:hypothetical protein [Neobacillus citreus]MCH6265344.1 McrC family protein [Neobacillus citreus]
MKQQFILSEYADIQIADYELTPDERDYLTRTSIIRDTKPWERRFYFDELKTGLRIKTQSWVGVIELDKMRIVIQPKFNKGFTDLIDMISFIEDLPFYQWEDSLGTLDKSDFLEILVRLFLKEVDQVFQFGIIKEYVTESDNLTNLRGRVHFRKNLQQNFNIPTKIYCNYDELVTDVAENQILLSVIRKITTIKLQQRTKQQLNQIRYQLEQLCSEYKGTEWPSFSYHRLNAHYERAHKLGRYLWERLSAKTFYTGKNFYYSFLIDMNELFERFVAQLLTKYLPMEYKITASKRITQAIQLDGVRYRDIIPDILVENKRTKDVKVLDVKYKQYGNKRVDTDDVFQLAFYAQNRKMAQDGLYDAAIIYPRFLEDLDMKSRRLALNLLSGYPGALHLHSLGIESVLQAVQSKKVDELKEIAINLIS